MDIDVVELARALAEIAIGTGESETAEKILDLVDRLLTEAGLSPAPSVDLIEQRPGLATCRIPERAACSGHPRSPSERRTLS